MSFEPQKFWTMCYSFTPPDEERGTSSTKHTGEIFKDLDVFFARYGISSMFDAGCNDAVWIKNLRLKLKYQGGDISATAIKRAHVLTDLDVTLHDITLDPIPSCDVLWIRDVMIHLSDADRKRVLTNWLSSSIPWLMMTQIDGVSNKDILYAEGNFPFSETNWYAEPWCFPLGTDKIYEMGSSSSRKMELWHRDQIQNLDCLKQQG